MDGEKEEVLEERIIIVGGGPAGIATGIQLRRHGLDPLILEGDHLGGLLIEANLVENFPGFPNGITGLKLIERLTEHLHTANVRYRLENVHTVHWDNGQFRIRTSSVADPDIPDQVRHYSCDILVIATGTCPKEPDLTILAGTKERIHSHVHDIRGLRDQTIAIIGAGDAAFDYALNLGQHNTVHILNRSEDPVCIPLLKERANQNDRIHYCGPCNIVRVDAGNDQLQLNLTVNEVHRKLSVDHLLFAIGREPDNQFISSYLDRTQLCEEGLLYFVGDVGNGIHRQATIAMGEGIRTAMQIAERFLEQSE